MIASRLTPLVHWLIDLYLLSTVLLLIGLAVMYVLAAGAADGGGAVARARSGGPGHARGRPGLASSGSHRVVCE